MLHTDYWYHGDGCVQIKKIGVQNEQSLDLKSQSLFEVKTFIYCFCFECNREVITRDIVPN